MLLVSPLLFMIMMHFACEESLPTYVDPSDLLTLTEISAEVTGVQRSYLTINIKGVNNYDDALQDTAGVKGNLHVWFPDNDRWQATLPIRNANIKRATEYNGRILTLAPGDTFQLQVTWNMVVEDTLDILPYFPVDFIYDRTGVKYLLPAMVNYQAEFSLYDQAGYLEFDTREYEFVGFWKDTLDVSEE